MSVRPGLPPVVSGRFVPPRRTGARLAVFLRDEPLGAIERRGPSRYRFTYSGQALAPPNTEGDVLLSASLPLQQKGFTPSRSAPFFEGLLPEGSVRKAMARKFGLSEDDGFGLLRELGADCAGAVVVLPEGEEPSASRDEGVRLLSAGELETLVDELPRRPLGVGDEPNGPRLSLGGVQDKLVLTRTPSGQYGQPTGGAPSTCLLKPDYGHYEDLAANEAFCMKVASATGLQVADTEIVRIGSTPCLFAERFDRVTDEEGRIVRVHQEDMCQALGMLPTAKYEANGGPSVAEIVGLFRDLRAPRAAADINAFIKAVLVDFLLGNSDAHGKNFALLYDPAAGTRLAPLYDVVSTSIYPELTDRMAMAIGGVEEPEEVDLAAWERLASDSGIGRQLPAFVQRWSADVLRCAEEVRQGAEAGGWHRPVIDRIIGLCRARAGRMAGR